jgi:hypothetical protein
VLDQFTLEITGLLAMMVKDGSFNPDWLAGLQQQVDNIAAVLEEYRANVARIKAMPDFSDIGKRNRIAQAASEAAGRIWLLGDVAEKYEQHGAPGVTAGKFTVSHRYFVIK